MPPQDPVSQYMATLPAQQQFRSNNSPILLKDTIGAQQPMPVMSGGSTANSTRGRPKEKQSWRSRLFGGNNTPRRSNSLPTQVTPSALPYAVQRPPSAGYPAAYPSGRPDSPLPFADGYQQVSTRGLIPETQYTKEDIPLPGPTIPFPPVVDPTTIPYQGGSGQRRSRSAEHVRGYHSQDAQLYDAHAYNQQQAAQQALVPWTGQQQQQQHFHSAALSPQYQDIYGATPQMIGGAAPSYHSQGYDLQQFAPMIEPQAVDPYGQHRSASPYRSTSPYSTHHTPTDYNNNYYYPTNQDMNMANYYTTGNPSALMYNATGGYGAPPSGFDYNGAGYEYYGDFNSANNNGWPFANPTSPWYSTSGSSPLMAY